MKLELKVGKYYQRADGSVVGPIRKQDDPVFPFGCAGSSGFRPDGAWSNSPSRLDLIGECTESGRPIPTKPRRKAKAKAKRKGKARGMVTGRNPKRPGLYVVYTNTSPECTIGKWDGKHWSLWCEMWDPAEWDPAQCLNCAVIRWAHPGDMNDYDFHDAAREARLFTTEKPSTAGKGGGE